LLCSFEPCTLFSILRSSIQFSKTSSLSPQLSASQGLLI